MTKTLSYTMKAVFADGHLIDRLNKIQWALRDPDKLGARFEWRLLPLEIELNLGPSAHGRTLHIEWDGKKLHKMTDADLARIVSRLRDLGFKEVTKKYLWDILNPTLPHDGYGRRDR